MDKKSKFSSKIGFLAAASSSAVGIGNIWRFPYTVGKYGGAGFLGLYLIFVCILGFPLVLAKLAYGRKTQSGTYNSYKNHKNWIYVGMGATIVSFIILSFYNIITGWLIGYFLKIASGQLLSVQDFNLEFLSFISDIKINFFYTALTTLIVAIIVKSGINKGIEKVSKVLMPLFIILMISLIIYALTLENSAQGLRFYLIPNFASITPQAVYAALTQSFLSLSIGSGICVTYGAYVSKKDDLVKSSAIIAISDTLVSFLAGLIIFPIIFFKGLSPAQGPSLIFISLPTAFQYLGEVTGLFFGSIFFLLLVFAAITSAISLLEVVIKYTIERFSISRSSAVYMVSLGIFLLSIPSILSFKVEFLKKIRIHSNVFYSFFDIISEISFDILMPLVGLMFSIFIVKEIKISTILKEINYKSKVLKIFLNVSIKYLAPVFISIAILIKIFEFWTGTAVA